ncbi:NAD(P)H-hydrate epimerase [Diaporthe amygdali]|uniref:NAD(P)H-hydrate epimerase n=1 Tax=Phomopsis amygdali TaxID=1214568 RepID=UPI0022FDB787|nr:NAD(P)H-hydrate epimerase [Diaporthe amygdali]KAJ0122960.1 NAD(P)H-hydrate epimerase [Diaporthe amygdali]
MTLKFLGPKAAAALDKELMSTGAFSIDQLMELAGLLPAVAAGSWLRAVPEITYGYQPTIYYPKRSKNELYQRLAKQLEDLEIPFTDDFPTAIESTDHIVDAVFGFSFSGEVREPFPAVIKAMEQTKLPVTSVDAPSSWNIEDGPPKSGLGSQFHPTALISLTAPKPLVQFFKGRHFIGGRFVAPAIAKKYDFEVPEYEGIDQVVEVGANGQKL